MVTTRITRAEPAARVVVPTGLLVGATYLAWRLGWTRTGTSGWLFWPLLIAEATILIELLRMTFEMWTLRSESTGDATYGAAAHQPSVDVVVVCRDEPVEVLRAALLGCAAIRGTHRTIALDTIGRPELAEITSDAGATHLVDSAGPGCTAEEHLNAALPHLDAELVTLLHGDDVPLPNLIEELAPDFVDESVWLAQGRQCVHGSPRDRVGGSPGRLEFFFSVVQPGKAHHDASYWCGSGGMLRRAALCELGGVPSTTDTPAFQLSLRAHREGWRSIYHDEPVVQSLAGPDLRRFLRQRSTWTRGHLRSLRTSESPLRPGGLTLAQRMAYLGTISTYLGGVRRAVIVAVVAATLLTGALPLSADAVLVASAWGMWMGFAVLTRRSLTRSDQHELPDLCE